MQVFDVFDGYRLHIEVSKKQLNATLVMLVMKTLCRCTEQIYQHPFAPLHAVPLTSPLRYEYPQAAIVEALRLPLYAHAVPPMGTKRNDRRRGVSFGPSSHFEASSSGT
jgi:hypothetical protein